MASLLFVQANLLLLCALLASEMGVELELELRRTDTKLKLLHQLESWLSNSIRTLLKSEASQPSTTQFKEPPPPTSTSSRTTN